MKKSTFIGNFVAWVAVAAACIAFLAWYHMTDASVVEAALDGSALVSLGVLLASPVLLFAMGAVIGLLLVWFKDILMGRLAKRACLAASVVALALFVLAAVPVFAPSAGGAFLGISVVVVYVARLAPILVMLFGFLYALGCAGVDTSKRGPFDKYLPKDKRGEKNDSTEKDDNVEKYDKDGRAA